MAEVDTKKLRKLLCEELNGMSASLGNLFSTQSVLESFARELFASKIITSNVNNNPNFESIRLEFENTMVFIESVSEMERHCIAFVQALESTGGEGGSTSRAADMLEDKWVKVAYAELDIVFIRKSSHETTDQSDDPYTPQLYSDNHHSYCTPPPSLPPTEKLRYHIQNNPTIFSEVLDVISAQLKQSPSPTSADKKSFSDIWKQQSSKKQPVKRKPQGNSESSDSPNYVIESSQVSQQGDHNASAKAWTNHFPFSHRAPYTDPSINYAERLSYDEYSAHSSGDFFGEGEKSSRSSPPYSRAGSRKTSRTTPSPLSKKSLSTDKLKVQIPTPPSSPPADDNLPGDFTDGTRPVLVRPQQSQIEEEEDSDINEMVGGKQTQPAVLTSTKKEDVRRPVSLISESQQWKAEVAALKSDLSAQIERLRCDLQKVQQHVFAAPGRKDDLAEKDSIICDLKETIASLQQSLKKKNERGEKRDAEIALLKKQQKINNNCTVYE